MSSLRKWVLTLGVAAATPSIAAAGPFDIFKGGQPAADARRGGEVDNQRVAEEIARALRGANLRGHDIDIEFAGGTAVLSGSAADARQKAQISRIVSQVPGVRNVDNRLAIGPKRSQDGPAAPSAGGAKPPINWASQPARRSAIEQVNATRSSGSRNQEMAERIASALEAIDVQGQGLKIQFQNGVTTLSGTVPDREQWIAAGRAAARVPGVQSVNNQLRIEGQGPVNAGGPFRGPNQAVTTAAYQPPPGAPEMVPGPPTPGIPAPPAGPTLAPPAGPDSQVLYNLPNVPEYAWPSYASYPNYAQVSYPSQYSASAWPYIGPFYPYPQVPLGWRKVELEWDDGYWNLNFNPRTDKWWWFLNPHNWE